MHRSDAFTRPMTATHFAVSMALSITVASYFALYGTFVVNVSSMVMA